jgi:hypothetical protein
MTNFLLALIALFLGLQTYMCWKALVLLNEQQPARLKEKEIILKEDKPDNIVMEWLPPESGEEIAFKESMKRIEESRRL